MAAGKSLLTVNFEVFGKVQGVFFRKYTHKKAMELGLKGWVQNTERKTVVGAIQGPSGKVTLMMTWLKTTGSRKSVIDNCNFTNVESETKFNSFEIRP